MSESVNFYQGSKENYNPSEMQGGVYFSKDSKEILLNGQSYGNATPADEEDITAEDGNLKLKDRAYDEANFSGKGYKILRKNIQQVTVPKFDLTISTGCTANGNITINEISIEVTTEASTPEAVAQLIQSAISGTTISGAVVTFTSNPTIDYSTTGVSGQVVDNSYQENRNILTQDMINEPNTIYEIRYDFDLNNQTINIPSNCILKFEGGQISNGTINGDNTTIIESFYCFNNIQFIGTILGDITILAFGAIKSKNISDIAYTNINRIQQAVDSGLSRIIVPNGMFIITGTINISKAITFCGLGEYSIIQMPYGTDYEAIKVIKNSDNINNYIYIENLNITGRDSDPNHNRAIYIEDLQSHAETGINVFLRNLYINNFRGGGIYVKRGVGCSLKNIKLYNIKGDYGIYLKGTDHLVESCDLYVCSEGGICVEGNAANIFNCIEKICGNATDKYAIYVKGHSAQIFNHYIQQNNGHGIYLEGTQHAVNNIVLEAIGNINNNSYPIYLQKCFGSNIKAIINNNWLNQHFKYAYKIIDSTFNTLELNILDYHRNNNNFGYTDVYDGNILNSIFINNKFIDYPTHDVQFINKSINKNNCDSSSIYIQNNILNLYFRGNNIYDINNSCEYEVELAGIDFTKYLTASLFAKTSKDIGEISIRFKIYKTDDTYEIVNNNYMISSQSYNYEYYKLSGNYYREIGDYVDLSNYSNIKSVSIIIYAHIIETTNNETSFDAVIYNLKYCNYKSDKYPKYNEIAVDTLPTLNQFNKGEYRFDKSNNKPVWWNGTQWVTSDGLDPDSTGWALIE